MEVSVRLGPDELRVKGFGIEIGPNGMRWPPAFLSLKLPIFMSLYGRIQQHQLRRTRWCGPVG